MIGQCLSNINESITIHILQKILELNKALIMVALVQAMRRNAQAVDFDGLPTDSYCLPGN